MGALNSRSIADYIKSLEAHARALEKELKEVKKTPQVNPINEELKKENQSLKNTLKNYEKNTKTRYRYSAYIQYAGRLMKVGEYKTPEEAEEAEKRAIKAL